jgi:peroxin-6
VSNTTESQLFILKALTRKIDLEEGLNLERVAEQCPFIYSGADLYALCADAQLQAISRTIERLEQELDEFNHQARIQGQKQCSAQEYLELHASEETRRLQVTYSDFVRALGQLEPSISATDLQRYEILKKQYQS